MGVRIRGARQICETMVVKKTKMSQTIVNLNKRMLHMRSSLRALKIPSQITLTSTQAPLEIMEGLMMKKAKCLI